MKTALLIALLFLSGCAAFEERHATLESSEVEVATPQQVIDLCTKHPELRICNYDK